METVRDDFEARWKKHGLDRLPPVSSAATIRPDTLSAPDVPPLRSPLAAAASDLVILRRLGEGGMGVVELALQTSLGREVAVKRAPDDSPGDGADARLTGALLREARTMGRLEHPNVVPVHALGVDEAGRPLLVMKRVSGAAWSDLARDPDHPLWPKLMAGRGERLTVHVEILRQLCNALDFAHSHGVLHRDIKLDNVMIGAFGEVYLLDWGVALARGAEEAPAAEGWELVGTPCNMAPEMFAGDVAALDERSDVYLLGAALHEVLTGRPRHDGATLQEVLQSAWASAPVAYPAAVPEELAALCNDATHLHPASRPASAAAFGRRLTDYLQHRGSTALARRAREALDRFNALPEVAGRSATSTPEAARLAAEARFGFAHALFEWPDNPQAREGMRACLTALAAREVVLRNAASARSLLEEVREPDPSLVARLEALERELAEERTHAEAGRRELREADPSVTAGARVALLVGALPAVLAVGALVFGLEVAGSDAAVMAQVVQSDVAILAVVGVAVLAGRRWLFRNRAGRHAVLALLALLLTGLGTDLVSWRTGVAPLAAIPLKFAAGGGALAVAALTLDVGLLVPVALMLAAVVAMVSVPATTEAVGEVTTVLVAAALVALTWRHVGRGTPPPA